MAKDSKGLKIGYWVTTGLLAAAMTMSGVLDLVPPAELVEAIEHLGYPTHLLTLLGIAKLLAVAAILAPGFARLKEWAYAGLAIDLIGAAWSHANSGDPIAEWAVIFVFMALLFASYFLRPASRRLPDLRKT
jgi:uncharacterized membrane protein YphA (DoxX/SURF4 family)